MKPAVTIPLMSDQLMSDRPALLIELLHAAYAAFNARDIDAALALMTPDVAWPKAFKGGFVRGPEEVRAYWTEQWSEIDPHVEPVSFDDAVHGEISDHARAARPPSAERIHRSTCPDPGSRSGSAEQKPAARFGS